MKYLLIDDDPVFTRVLSKALQERGCTVAIAENSGQALSLCEQEPFDRIVLDLKLDAENGLNLLPQLLAIQITVPILLLTGYSSIQTAVKAMRLGAVNYLCKPASVDEILAAFTPDAQSLPEIEDKPHSVERLQWEHIQTVLEKNEGNISATARDLGMHRRTLQRRLQKKPVKK